jgi:plasmid maintenance system antidote protein VapI
MMAANTRYEDFRNYIDDLVGRTRTATALADQIGMTLSAFSRAVNVEGTFSIENCIRLAQVSGDHPSVVLRLAGKDEMADMLDTLYGADTKLSRREREALDTWRKLPPSDQAAFLHIARRLVELTFVFAEQ